MNSLSRSSGENESPEESSWTMYLQDFSNNNNDTIDVNDNGSILSHTDHRSSSLIPDAACSAAGRHVFGAALDHKKRRIKRPSSSGFVDRDLEDTATSPANSPEVYDLVNKFDQQKNAMGISQGIKGGASGKINDELMSFDGGEDVNNELKKKGLCLVPLSMVVHYLG
ncbi:Electron transfer flavoprotein alpha isoform 1 [Hibiscus syriacus]|uniref:Electron transfer flavoprotein alpha isoform 1 n=1 Tax=Hibiscus syriacus TaxID=106335 RepID=A0A6A2YGQ3_HIBSY|nr:vascular-related unknown protein 4-like [Hibiscus syriacus]KAE8679126.1 Electron transfer flavoprotein alpha isoform 1 [Hibiscus syriacus]